ncbi:MAG: AsmA-like C-terminal region-containing protein, partial [Pseudomonadota bacterium]
QISGPSAKILMNGSVSLPQETQNLKVRVQPALGETFAVGAMLSHPAAGAIVWLADKIFKNPLDQIFAYDYAVTGSWADPKVEKLSGQQTIDENTAPSSGGKK